MQCSAIDRAGEALTAMTHAADIILSVITSHATHDYINHCHCILLYTIPITRYYGPVVECQSAIGERIPGAEG